MSSTHPEGRLYFRYRTPDMLSHEQLRRQAEYATLRYDDYRCPFNILYEFDRWIEWKRREHFDKESTGSIICSMLQDIQQIKAHKLQKPTRFRVMQDYGISTRPEASVLNRP